MSLKFKKVDKCEDVKRIDCSSSGVYILKTDMVLTTESGQTCAQNCKDFACFKNDVLVYDGRDLIFGDGRLTVDACSDVFLNDNIGLLRNSTLIIYDRKFKVLGEYECVSKVGFLSDGFIVELTEPSSTLRIYKNLEKFDELSGKLLFCKENVYGVLNEKIIIYKNHVVKQRIELAGGALSFAEFEDIGILYDDEEFRYFYRGEEVINQEEEELLVMGLDKNGESVGLRDIVIFRDLVYLLGYNDTLTRYKIEIENDKGAGDQSSSRISMLDMEPDLDFNELSLDESTAATNAPKREEKETKQEGTEAQEESSRLTEAFKSTSLFSSKTGTLAANLFTSATRETGAKNVSQTTIFKDSSPEKKSFDASIQDKPRNTTINLNVVGSSSIGSSSDGAKSVVAGEEVKNKDRTAVDVKAGDSITGLFQRGAVVGNTTGSTRFSAIDKKESISSQTAPKNPDEVLKTSLRCDINSLMNDFMSIKTNTYQFESIDDLPDSENYRLIYTKLKFLETVNERSIKKELSRLNAMLNRKITFENYLGYFDEKIKVLNSARYLIKHRSAPVYDSAFSNRQLAAKFLDDLKLLDAKAVNKLDKLEERERMCKSEQVKTETAFVAPQSGNNVSSTPTRNEPTGSFQPPSIQQNIFQEQPLFNPMNSFSPNTTNSVQNSSNTPSSMNTRTSTFSRFLNKQNDVLKKMEERK
ncbi:hypothetical protein VCUG_01133 [Vavraia culicis subsp. floridensis]|uniref:Uncharacterized protein n=1 Tax=Vavraia culicis (isolate floridensis) TaxID=948595 RepID=L2GUT1_VAVCU|nr:uncharacterized protein VCUG_01133 [Vavraia culicis subsp. floridensis]ELA47364.1 hypothetical protein VCUG_01133 [Vavraia culicis subsp. floridensis]